MRRLVLIATGALVLVVANFAIFARERQLASGTRLILALAPVDPRSLMQGDYMALAYAVERDGIGEVTEDGRVILATDERAVARFVRRDDGSPLAMGEVPVDYRVRHGRVRIGTDAWFFPQGHATEYQAAKYGEFRADGHGAVLLVALLDERLVRLGPGR